jgi:ABC-type uncharacterized transport system permease subunit
MSNGTFVLVLATGAALLAMWTHVRFPSLAPERIGRTVMHSAGAFVLLKFAASVEGGASVLVPLFLLVLPALVYALLCVIWVIQHAQTALGLSR